MAAFTQKLLDGVKKFFHSKEVHEKYLSVTLTSKQFKDFATRIDENIYAMQSNMIAKSSTGYKILQAVHISHSLYQYAPKSQKDFDKVAAKNWRKNILPIRFSRLYKI